MFHSAEKLLRSRSVAIVGASETAWWPKVIFENLRDAGYDGNVYLINPRYETLWDSPCYPDFAALPEPVDHALVIVPADAVPGILADGVAHGLAAASVYSAGFSEGGDAAGAARAAELRALCDDSGLALCGPNCMASISVRERLFAYPNPRLLGLRPGPVGAVFHSGGSLQFWLDSAGERGVGFSYAISSGNETGLDLADYLNFLVEDPETRIITLLIEGIRRPDAFVAAVAKARAAGKPILLVKIGASAAGKTQALSHTGALAGDDAVFDAVCARYGLVRCHTLDDMLETLLVALTGRVPATRGVAVVAGSGAVTGLMLDHGEADGVRFAEFTPETIAAIRPLLLFGTRVGNPLDCGPLAWRAGEDYVTLCRAILDDDNVGALALLGMQPKSLPALSDPKGYAAIAAATEKPVVGFARIKENVTPEGVAFAESAAIPFLQGMPETLRALDALALHGERIAKKIPALAAPAGRVENLESAAWGELLRSHGLTPPRAAFAASADAAVAAAEAIGFPVALKLVSPQVSHKTEVGGVRLNLAESGAVARAAGEIAAGLAAARPGAVLDGYLVQEMVDGVEMIVGARDDPQFGPYLLVGFGGVFVELMRDVALRLLPVDTEMAAEMVDELAGRAILDGFRGRPPADRPALSAAIAGLSAFYLDHRPFLSDLEVNPLIVLAEGGGVRAADIRLIRAAAEGGRDS